MQQDNRKAPFEIFLIGDTGSIARNKPDPVMEMLNTHFNPAQPSCVIFLGDNVYPRGLPPHGNILRSDAEAALNAHYNALKNYHGKVLFISGNHDWNKGRKNGHEYVERQEKYIEKLFGKNVFLPSRGCPGPSEIDVNDNVCIVLINTQWWLQSQYRPIGKACGCRVESEEEFFEQLEAILKKNKNRQVLVCGHAPVYSYAIHGGRYKLRHHIFPFTIYNRRAYVPLPFLGSLLPLYRKFLGAREDIAHPRYRRLRQRLKDLFSKYPGIIYAAGHEHNLQHITKYGNHYLVSGAGSKLKYVIEEGKNLLFGMKAKGFFKTRFESDGSVEVTGWVLDHDNPMGKQVYTTVIR